MVYKAEYIWVDGTQPTSKLRSKTKIIEDGKKAGVIRPDVMPAIAKRALFGALDEMLLYWVLAKKPKYSLEQSVEQISRFFIDGLRTRKADSDPKDSTQSAS